MPKSADILKLCDSENVQFMRLMFTDMMGAVKNVEIPRSQFEKALAGISCSTAPPLRGLCASRNRTCS